MVDKVIYLKPSVESDTVSKVIYLTSKVHGGMAFSYAEYFALTMQLDNSGR